MNSSKTSTERWTLTELTSKVAIALSTADIDQHSARVRDVPNARTIRYYTTIGLVDRPLAFRGRTALYGSRHLLQLVAIKQLQARGRTLEEIQQQLLGLGDDALRGLSGVVEVSEEAARVDEVEELELKAESRRAGAFWETASAPVMLPGPAESGRKLKRVQGVELEAGVTLLLGPGVRSLDDSDLEAIQAAAGPLIKVLEARRLLGVKKREN